MPIGVALTGNVAGFEYTLKREFCSSCHVMLPYTEDAADPKSDSLAAIHSRNKSFAGRELLHVPRRLQDFRRDDDEAERAQAHVLLRHLSTPNSGAYGENGPRIHLYKPFKNESCTRCHSTTAPNWLSVEDHGGHD